MTTLGAWLKTQGFTVDDNDVPLGRTSTWKGVSYLMVHHTVSPCTGSESSIATYCRNGGPGTYPPLCQIVLGHSGKVWMTCRELSGQKDPGRASHAGNGAGYGIAKDSMNEHALGIEVQCDGSHKLATHVRQYAVLTDLLAALSRHYKVPVANVIGHKEWSTTGKVDPRDDMNVIRADVAKKLKGDAMAARPYRNIKVETPQTIKLNAWVTIDLGAVDAITPPVGSNDWWVQVHLALSSATVARNELRYVKGRWARKRPTGDDTHGTDTKAISPDLPKDSWQGSWSTDMKGLAGVPVAFEVYVGATKDGTITSPMRLFTIDDETT